ncbi:MAG: class I SAM-dependent methyltransferase [Candidatus Muiribacteriaceae bacterium]
MDNQTLRYYSKDAEKIFKRYMEYKSGIRNFFSIAFPKPEKIIDIGCGSGRDMINLLEMGHDVYGIEPCNELRMLAELRNPILKGRIKHGYIPVRFNPFRKRFNSIVCSAVLMHVPDSEIEEGIASFNDLLEPRGKVLISIPARRPDINEIGRDSYGRLFNRLSEDDFCRIFNSNDFMLVKKWESDDIHRPGFVWSTLLFQAKLNLDFSTGH